MTSPEDKSVADNVVADNSIADTQGDAQDQLGKPRRGPQILRNADTLEPGRFGAQE